MLRQPGFWLMVAGALLTTFGFFGFALSQNNKQMPVRNAEGKQRSSNLFSAGTKKEADTGQSSPTERLTAMRESASAGATLKAKGK